MLAELLAAREGMRVRINDVAAGHLKLGRVYYDRGGPAEGPLGDGTTSYMAMCRCGRPHLVGGRELAAAAAAGEPLLIIEPMR